MSALVFFTGPKRSADVAGTGLGAEGPHGRRKVGHIPAPKKERQGLFTLMPIAKEKTLLLSLLRWLGADRGSGLTKPCSLLVTHRPPNGAPRCHNSGCERFVFVAKFLVCNFFPNFLMKQHTHNFCRASERRRDFEQQSCFCRPRCFGPFRFDKIFPCICKLGFVFNCAHLKTLLVYVAFLLGSEKKSKSMGRLVCTLRLHPHNFSNSSRQNGHPGDGT